MITGGFPDNVAQIIDANARCFEDLTAAPRQLPLHAAYY